ncbi:MAG TPA: Nif11-like leader peptide family RiPP precursor [Bacillota bacterium]|nr:Nif11-like leader peptide family RiPP precursor [Bacillota bacterium]
MEASQTVKNFFMRLNEDEELRGKFEAAAKREDLEECVLLSKEAGFTFTQADLEYMGNLGKAYKDGELSEEQLELVSGGCIIELIIFFAWLGVAALVSGATVVKNKSH